MVRLGKRLTAKGGLPAILQQDVPTLVVSVAAERKLA